MNYIFTLLFCIQPQQQFIINYYFEPRYRMTHNKPSMALKLPCITRGQINSQHCSPSLMTIITVRLLFHTVIQCIWRNCTNDGTLYPPQKLEHISAKWKTNCCCVGGIYIYVKGPLLTNTTGHWTHMTHWRQGQLRNCPLKA